MRVAMYYNNRDVRLEEMPVPSVGAGGGLGNGRGGLSSWKPRLRVSSCSLHELPLLPERSPLGVRYLASDPFRSRRLRRVYPRAEDQRRVRRLPLARRNLF